MRTLEDQLDCIKRDLAHRREVYPSMIERLKVTPEVAASEIECLESVVATLQRSIDLRDVGKAMVEAIKVRQQL